MKLHCTFYILRLVGLWVATVAGLYYIWPMEPRFSIPDASQFQFIGITSDSRHLLALTRRAAKSDKDFSYHAVFSGPFQSLDLNSGEWRVTKLPHQNDSGGSVLTVQGWHATVDSDGWILNSPALLLNENRYRFTQMNRRSERFAVEIALDQGVVVKDTELPNVPAPLELTTTEMSPQGRWIADHFRDEAPLALSEESLRLIDCNSGLVVKEFAPSSEYAVCFSEDDSVVAVSNGFDKSGSTTIWRLDPFEPLQTIGVSSPCMRFSPSNRQIAVRHEDDKVLIFDIETGATLHDFHMNGQIKSLRFASDESHVFGYEFVCGRLSSCAIYHHMISEVQIWNLTTEQYLGKKVPALMPDDVNVFPNGWVDQMSRIVLQDGKRLIDAKTGQATLEIPNDSNVEAAPPESNFVTVHCPRDDQSNGLLTLLSNWNIPLPSFLFTHTFYSTLQVLDSKSGWKSPVLPHDKHWINSGTLFLSPDRKTLVTESSWPSPTIRVWDLTKPKSWMKPCAWSLLTPLCILAWQWVRATAFLRYLLSRTH